MTDIQEAIGNLAEAARQFGITLADTIDAINEAARAFREIMVNWQLPESWVALSDYSKVLAQDTPKELHYINNAKKARTRKKYINRVKHRIRKEQKANEI